MCFESRCLHVSLFYKRRKLTTYHCFPLTRIASPYFSFPLPASNIFISSIKHTTMSQTTKNAIVKSIFLTAASFTILVSSFANGSGKLNKTRLSGDQVSVQYTGVKDNSYAFAVQFDNTEAQKFTLIVKNDEGEVVYQEQFSDLHFAKTILLPKDLGEIHPTFIIRSGNQQVEHSFTANTKVVENIVVTKL